MLTLHHWPLDPFSRQVRLALAEKRAQFHLVEERAFAPSDALMAMTPEGRVPVLVDTTGGGRVVVPDARPALEYLEDLIPTTPLLPGGPPERAEARRLAVWIDRGFDADVNAYLLHEKLEKRIARLGAPDPSALRAGLDHLRWRLDRLAPLCEHRNYLAGDRYSHADIAAASHLSCLDYVATVPWDEAPAVKEWYAKVKSRPAFRPLLADVLPGMPPPAHYANPDF
jgi:glutathione S-transferase